MARPRPPSFTIRRDLRHVWRKSGLSGRLHPPHQSLGRFFEDKKTRIDHPEFFPVLNWIAVLDEYAYLYAMTSLLMKGGDENASKKELCYKFLYGGIASNVNCIRSLALDGFDVQARALSRLLSEQVDILIYLNFFPEHCSEYQAAESEIDANKFWHAHISKGKIKAAIRTKLLKDDPQAKEAIDEFAAYTRSEESMTSMIVHPSYLACAMSSHHGSTTGGSILGSYGIPDSASIRTLSFVFSRLFELQLFTHKLLDHCLNESRSSSVDDSLLNIFLERSQFVSALGAYVSLYRDFLPLNSGSEQEDEAD